MKKSFIIIAVLLIIACLCFALYFTYAPDEDAPAPDYSKMVHISEMKQNKEQAPEKSDGQTPYVSPIDFDALWKRNKDIIAWVDIPNTYISYPVVQREGNDAYYLNHNSDGKRSAIGAICSESTYNSKDFSDLITILYGHHIRGTTMFGKLQNLYSEKNAMDKYGLICVYLPDKEIDYEVFAAVPYSSAHILYTYGANDLHNKRLFQYQISNTHSLDGTIVKERFPNPDEHILILSTCLQGNRMRRFIVLARQISNQ